MEKKKIIQTQWKCDGHTSNWTSCGLKNEIKFIGVVELTF